MAWEDNIVFGTDDIKNGDFFLHGAEDPGKDELTPLMNLTPSKHPSDGCKFAHVALFWKSFFTVGPGFNPDFRWLCDFSVHLCVHT